MVEMTFFLVADLLLFVETVMNQYAASFQSLEFGDPSDHKGLHVL